MSSRDDGVLERMGLSDDDAATSVWVVAPGVRFGGAAAVALAVSVGLGTALPLRLWRLPGFGASAECAYRFVARHRHRLV